MPPRRGAALFSRRADVILRWVVLGLGALLLGVPAGLIAGARLPIATGEGQRPAQPMWFDHRHHVAGFRIDCRYCHSAAIRSPSAGVPATGVCVPCHDAAWLQGPHFAPVRQSLATGRPIPWRRVHDLPDHVFFNHAIHVNKGVGCETCHGRVDRMALVEQVAPLTMSWCLECHRAPERFLRPTGSQRDVGLELKRRYGVQELTHCTACHR